MKIIENDEAVSPVIGVILMVAITVILAAVIAAFVFGLAGSTGTSKNVGLTMGTDTAGYARITIQGGSDLPSMTDMWYLINGTAVAKDFVYPSAPTVKVTGNSTAFPLTVGQVVNTSDKATGSKITVIAKFSDGSTQTLLDRQF